MLVFYRPVKTGSGGGKLMRDLTEAEQRRMAEESRLAAERAAIERDAGRLAWQRQQLEEQALVEAQRREQAAADLRDATAARLKRENQARELAEARLASEQAALQAANDKIQMERSIEASTLSRVAAERDAARLAAQRALREEEAARAEAARRDAETQLRQAAAAAQQAGDRLDVFGPSTVPADAPARPAPGVESPPRPGRATWPLALAATLLMGVLAGWLAAVKLGTVESAAALRLDTDAEAFGRRAATADFQDSSRRRVSPSAIQ
jgi:hypothetical protein